jgi:hypothetical protein
VWGFCALLSLILWPTRVVVGFFMCLSHKTPSLSWAWSIFVLAVTWCLYCHSLPSVQWRLPVYRRGDRFLEAAVEVFSNDENGTSPEKERFKSTSSETDKQGKLERPNELTEVLKRRRHPVRISARTQAAPKDVFCYSFTNFWWIRVQCPERDEFRFLPWH